MTRKIYTLFSTLSLYLFLATPSYAATSVDPCPRDAGGQLSKLCSFNQDTLANMVQVGITILLILATGACLFFLIAGGIKWITSGGDKANIEQARNWIIAAIVGLIITFLSFFILSFILTLFGLPTVGDFTIPKFV